MVFGAPRWHLLSLEGRAVSRSETEWVEPWRSLLPKAVATLDRADIRAARYPFRPGVSLALDAGPPSPRIAPSSLGKEMFLSAHTNRTVAQNRDRTRSYGASGRRRRSKGVRSHQSCAPHRCSYSNPLPGLRPVLAPFAALTRGDRQNVAYLTQTRAVGNYSFELHPNGAVRYVTIEYLCAAPIPNPSLTQSHKTAIDTLGGRRFLGQDLQHVCRSISGSGTPAIG